MLGLLYTIAAFVLALGLLVAVHEWGHYRMAVACGVRVLRFSIGFGPVLFTHKPKKQRPGQDTEFTLSALPLGGYVRMLDKRDPQQQPISPEAMRQEFTSQVAWKRFLIVAAGPVANLLLAIALYTGLALWGLQLPSAVLGAPAPHSIAAQAGIQGGEVVQSIGRVGQAQRPVRSLDDVRWLATQAALEQRDVRLITADGRPFLLPFSTLEHDGELNQAFMQQIGIGEPWLPAVIGTVLPEQPAAQAGLQSGDRVIRINGQATPHAMALLQAIQSGADAQGAPLQHWLIERQGQTLSLDIQPYTEAISPEQPSFDGRTAGWVGKVGIGVQPPAFERVRLGPVAAVQYGWQRTWEYAALSLRMLWRMATGQASTKNLSGTLTIADMAGQSAALGLLPFISFLAVISVSLGVMNLLPIPLPALDGGYLVHYAVEILTSKTVSEAQFAFLQRLGVMMIIGLMLLAHWNDFNRYFLQ